MKHPYWIGNSQEGVYRSRTRYKSFFKISRLPVMQRATVQRRTVSTSHVRNKVVVIMNCFSQPETTALHASYTALSLSHLIHERLHFQCNYRYNRKKYTPATMQMINKPQIMVEVRLLTSNMPALKRIVPMVRIRKFFIATALHQQLRSCMGYQ